MVVALALTAARFLSFQSRSRCLDSLFFQVIRQVSSSNMKEEARASAVTAGFSRLPNHVEPVNYNIHLKPCLKTFVFSGDEKVELSVREDTDKLKLYSADIEILEASYAIEDGKVLEKLSHTADEKFETVEFSLPEKLKAGSRGTLSLKFKGNLNDQMKGFYRSNYKMHDGEERFMATTQFESTFARYSFPCWDEPVYKATFDISLTVPKDKCAISNMPEISTTDADNNCKTVTYGRTPKMSSYLVAYCVGDFEFLEGKTADGVIVRVITMPGKKHLGQFALDCGIKCLPYYNKYFGVDYPLPKCDMIAVPDFNFGAMENWGLVTYREVRLLVDPEQTSARVKEDVALVVGHELAHMWFGNLVTMKWWTDLWLKEGYASFMEYMFTDFCFPQFSIFDRFISSEVSTALKLDSLKNSHPIEVPIGDPKEVEGIYDSISYAKSNSVIRMLHTYVGDATFRAALNKYLTSHQYNNATTMDLWKAITEVSGKNVAEIMGNWTKCMGFPLIEASAVYADGNVKLSLKQSRFIADGSDDPEKTVWQVPITVMTKKSDGIKQSELLTTKEGTFELKDVGPDEWIKINPGFTGFYRVQYSKEMLDRLLPTIMELSNADRFNIVSDMFALVRAGKSTTASFLDVALSLSGETNLLVWEDLDDSIGTLSNCFARTSFKEKFDKFVQKLYTPIYDKIGFESQPGEGHTEAMLRPIIIGRLGAAGHAGVIEECRKRFQAFVDKNETIPADIRSKVFGVVSRHGDLDTFDQLCKIKDTTESKEVELNCISSIGQGEHAEKQEKALQYTLSDKVRLQDLIYGILGLVVTASGQEKCWNFFKNNHKVILDKFGGKTDSGLFMHVLKMSCGRHCSDALADEIEAFFKEHKESAWVRPSNQCIEAVRLNAALLKRDEAPVKAWLDSKGF